MRKFVTVVALLLALPMHAQTANCRPDAENTSMPVIRFGALVPLSGVYSREGQDILGGLLIWRDWVNNERGGVNVGGVCHRVDLMIYDDQSSLAADSLESLIYEQGAQFIFGPYSTPLMHAAAVISEREKMILMETGGTDESLFTHGFRYVFGLVTPAEAYTASGIEEAFRLGARTAVIAYEETTLAVAQRARDTLDRLGMRTLAFEPFPPAADLMPLFTRFRDFDPDLFIGSGYGVHLDLFVRAARDSAFSPDAFLVTRGNPDAEYVWSTQQWLSTLRYTDSYFGMAGDYAARYEQAFGAAPRSDAAEATATALVLFLAIESADSVNTEAVREALLNLSADTFYGTINFDETGMSVNPPAMTVQVQNGIPVTIAPPEIAAASPIWPAPNWEER